MTTEEMTQLNNIKKTLEDHFDDMPEIQIFEGKHYFMTAGWAFILTFDDNGFLLLLFDNTINPLLSAKLTQVLGDNHIQFEIRENYYYSPYEKIIYYGAMAALKQSEDHVKQILQSNGTRTRQ